MSNSALNSISIIESVVDRIAGLHHRVTQLERRELQTNSLGSREAARHKLTPRRQLPERRGSCESRGLRTL
jgi:hypothetical protein